LGVDDGLVVSVSIRGVDRGDKVKGHLTVVDTVSFLAEIRMLERVGVGDMDSSSWFELVVLKGREDCRVAVDECPEAGRGHDEDESSN